MLLEGTEKPRRKSKSVTMREDLIGEIENFQKENSLNYSSALEKIVEVGVNELKREKLAREVRAYYQSLSDAEKQEREEWLDRSWDSLDQLEK